MRILIVDDTTFMRATIRQMIEHEGNHTILEAENGLDAIQKYKILKPHMVIMDISMPIMDGIEAVTHLKQIDPNADILMCSLQGQRSSVMKAIVAGARSFILKPIKQEKLYAELETSRRLAEERRALQSEDPGFDQARIKELDDLIAKTYGDLEEIKKDLLEANPSDDYLKGVERGYLEARREIAINMLRMSIGMDLVVQCVELSEQELEAYKKAYLG